MSEQIKIQVLIKEETPYGEFNDAIYYDDMMSYQTALDNGSHETEKTTRVANYISAVENPVIPEEPTKEELETLKTSLLSQVSDLDIKIAEADSDKVIIEK